MYTYRNIRHAMFNVTYALSSFVVLLLRMGLYWRKSINSNRVFLVLTAPRRFLSDCSCQDLGLGDQNTEFPGSICGMPQSLLNEDIIFIC